MPRARVSGWTAALAAGRMKAGVATPEAVAAGSAASFVAVACAERCSGAGGSTADDASAGASAGTAGNVCALTAQAMPAETMQTSDESDEEQFMTNRTE